MEATRGNGYAPAWGSLVMMIHLVCLYLPYRDMPCIGQETTWLQQIGDGSAASMRQEWDLAVGRGHSQRMRPALRASAAQAFWWWWHPFTGWQCPSYVQELSLSPSYVWWLEVSDT